MTTIEARITEALEGHQQWVSSCGPEDECLCGADLGSSGTVDIAAHQAAVVAGIVTAAQAEAWDQGRWIGSGRSVASALLLRNPYRKDAQ